MREWLEGKFADRVISRFSDSPWSCTPDISLDHWLWSVCLAELPPGHPEDVIANVEYKDSLE